MVRFTPQLLSVFSLAALAFGQKQPSSEDSLYARDIPQRFDNVVPDLQGALYTRSTKPEHVQTVQNTAVPPDITPYVVESSTPPGSKYEGGVSSCLKERQEKLVRRAGEGSRGRPQRPNKTDRKADSSIPDYKRGSTYTAPVLEAIHVQMGTRIYDHKVSESTTFQEIKNWLLRNGYLHRQDENEGYFTRKNKPVPDLALSLGAAGVQNRETIGFFINVPPKRSTPGRSQDGGKSDKEKIDKSKWLVRLKTPIASVSAFISPDKNGNRPFRLLRGWVEGISKEQLQGSFFRFQGDNYDDGHDMVAAGVKESDIVVLKCPNFKG